MKSLRRRFTVWLLVATMVLAITAGASLYLYLREAMLQQFDAGLTAKIQAIASLLRVEIDGSYAMDFSDESMPEYLPGRNAEFFQIVLPGRATLQRSASLKGRDLVPETLARAGRHAWDMKLPDGKPGRAMARLAYAQPEDDDEDNSHKPAAGRVPSAAPLLIVVARSRSDIDRVLAALLTALIVAAVVLIAAGILVVRFVVGQALRPVNDLAERARSIGPENLNFRFDVAALPEELQPICQRLNNLLERLDEAFSRERRLNSDIAHELRTPIAELRSLTEVACRWPLSSAEAEGYFRDAHEIALKMGSLIETLFALARSPVDPQQIQRATVPLVPLFKRTLSHFQAEISARELSVSLSIPEDAEIKTDPPMFARLIENLLVNAVVYATTGGSIECVVEQISDGCIIKIGNNTDSLKPVDLPRMFEPFWRKDPARTGDAHSGLGLALVTEYAKRLGISVTADLRSPNWFQVTLRPISPKTQGKTVKNDRLPVSLNLQ